MAQTCVKCGKKIGAFSMMPLELMEGEQLCYDCAEAIQPNITKLYGAKTIEEFDKIRGAVSEISRDNYDESVCRMIEVLINKILTESDYIKPDQISNPNTAINEKEHADKYMMTTGYDFTGYRIKKYIGIVSGQVVLGTGFLSEFTASFSDFFGVQSDKFAIKLEQAKNAALEKLVKKSDIKGGNAIIGVDFDYITFHGNMIGVVANGTSVVIEKDADKC